MEYTYLLIGLLIGAVAVWFWQNFAQKQVKIEAESLKDQISKQLVQINTLESQSELAKQEIVYLKLDAKTAQIEEISLNKQLTQAQTEAKSLATRFEEQKAELITIKEQFTKEFENLANRIFEEKSQKFTDQNRTNLEVILNPFKERIKDFEEKVQRNYDEDIKEKAALKNELKLLFSLNQQMSKEANNLTRALKGDTKTQGNWGEFILESILERSGLVKDREYIVQASFTNEEGRRQQPDIIINLPEGKHLIIDSKVSLVAYDKYCSATDDGQMLIAAKEHITSFRAHLKGLSDKKYQTIYNLRSLDFVLMFIPIEPAFALAIQKDEQLFNEAFERNIVIVSPSTLLATLRTVANIWRNEKYTENANEIARIGGVLYDRLHAFVQELIVIGNKINQSQSAYEDAMKKLVTGNQSVIKSAEKIRILGAKATKTFDTKLLERAEED